MAAEQVAKYARFLAAFVALAFVCLGAAGSELREIRAVSSDRAIVLIGGLDGRFEYFTPWMPQFRLAGASVYGFVHDHRAGPMIDGANDLKQELLGLNGRGVRKITILAHSMGGLVAKKALHLLTLEEAARFESVELRTYGAPWGGYFMANFARWLPPSQLFASWLGFPMAAEIGSRSPFMLSLRAPLPPNMRLVVYASTDDDVASPKDGSELRQFMGVLATAQEVHALQHVAHGGFINVLAFSN